MSIKSAFVVIKTIYAFTFWLCWVFCCVQALSLVAARIKGSLRVPMPRPLIE